MSLRRSRFALALLVAVIGSSSHLASATECAPSTRLSPCFEADALAVPVGHAFFAGFPAPRAVPAGQAALTLGQSFVLRPLALHALSPAPEGRRVPVVDHELGLTLGIALGVGHGVELTFALPMTLLRGGAGSSAFTGAEAHELSNSAVYDPRLGVVYTPWVTGSAEPFGLKARLEVSLPAGEEEVFAGHVGVGLLPAVAAELKFGRFRLGGELKLRLGETVEFAAVPEGAWFGGSLGLGVALLGEEALSFAAEGVLRQSFDQPDVASGTATTSGPAAEWLASLRSARGPYALLVGGGTGLPLAREQRGEKSSWVLAPTAPAFRALLRLSYTP